MQGLGGHEKSLRALMARRRPTPSFYQQVRAGGARGWIPAMGRMPDGASGRPWARMVTPALGMGSDDHAAHTNKEER
ncbi:hypothetical protein KNE206_45000 [Kitasatospora sp. NE20-6]